MVAGGVCRLHAPHTFPEAPHLPVPTVQRESLGAMEISTGHRNRPRERGLAVHETKPE